MKELKDLKLKDSKKLKVLGIKELREEIKVTTKKMFEITAKLSLSELKQTHLVKFLRRYIAQLRTLEKAKSLES